MAGITQWRAGLLTAERCDDLVCEFLLPLVPYRDDRPVVHRHDEVVGRFAQLRANHASRWAARTEARVTATELQGRVQFRVWMKDSDPDANGLVLSRTDVVQYCRETAAGLKTEMAEYSKCALPEIWTANRTATAREA